jgi:hypothetical protein
MPLVIDWRASFSENLLLRAVESGIVHHTKVSINTFVS